METTSSKNQTCSFVIPWYNKLLDHCESARNFYNTASQGYLSTTKSGRQSKLAAASEAMQNLWDAAEYSFAKLEKFFNVSSDFCITAVVLDPRFKLHFFDEDNRTNEDNQKQRTIVEDHIKILYDLQYAPFTTASYKLQ